MPASEQELTETLRSWLLGQMHVGNIRPGDAIPSIRKVARSHSADHRVVARAYAQLQHEGLVEVRGRSGVFAAPAPTGRAAILRGRGAWLASILGEAWNRQISLAELADLVDRCTRHGLRCACVESTEDHAIAIAAEAAFAFGLETVIHRFEALPDGSAKTAAVDDLEQVIADCDLVLTTVFHARSIAPIAHRVGRPCVAIAINPLLREEIRQRLAKPLTVVVADPLFADRARLYFGDAEMLGTLQLMLADDVDPATLDGRDDVLLTRAARRRLGLAEYHLMGPTTSYIAPESARGIAAAIVRIMLDEDDPGEPGDSVAMHDRLPPGGATGRPGL